jgi:hypothetical protein
MPDSTAPAAEPSTHPALPPATGRRVLVNTGALTSASLWRIAMSFILQLLIARRLGVEALGIYTTAMAYLNVSQVFTELGLPALLVRDLAQEPAHRRSYFRRMLVIQVSAALLTWGALVLLTGILPYSSATVWGTCGWWAHRCRSLPSPRRVTRYSRRGNGWNWSLASKR